jgi:predicted membrane protein
MSEFDKRWERREKRWEERRERWENKMQRYQRHGHIWTGLIILIIGVAALLKAIAVPMPSWLFTWPMIIILIGFISGVKSGFKGMTWFFLMLVGGAFLTGYIVPEISVRKFVWPSVLILIGLAFIFRPRRSFGDYCTPGEKKTSKDSGVVVEVQAGVEGESQNSSEEILDSTSIFGGIKKNILTKNFRGGDVTNIMGGTELNFSQADIKGEVILEMTQIFGGTKIVVPSDWDVKSDIVAIFGGIEDKRSLENVSINPGKVLLLKGTSIFAGIEIRNF